MCLFPSLLNFFRVPLPTPWIVPLDVRVPQVGNHCTTGLVTVRPVAASKLIYQQLFHNTNEVVNL